MVAKTTPPTVTRAGQHHSEDDDEHIKKLLTDNVAEYCAKKTFAENQRVTVDPATATYRYRRVHQLKELLQFQ